MISTVIFVLALVTLSFAAGAILSRGMHKMMHTSYLLGVFTGISAAMVKEFKAFKNIVEEELKNASDAERAVLVRLSNALHAREQNLHKFIEDTVQVDISKNNHD